MVCWYAESAPVAFFVKIALNLPVLLRWLVILDLNLCLAAHAKKTHILLKIHADNVLLGGGALISGNHFLA